MHPNETLAVIVVLSIAENIRTKRKLRRAAQEFLAHHNDGVEIMVAQQAQIKYLCELIDKSGLELTEIDLLELNYLLP